MKPLTVIDFHSHILPALDHGCEKIDECRGQLALMSDCGTDIAVATSHFYPHMHDINVFADKVDRAIDKIRSADITKAPELRIGAEVLLFSGMNNMENLGKLCIRGTNLLLLELPNTNVTDAHVKTVESILCDGYRVILAHIDRYVEIQPEKIREFLSYGALAQINASSLFSHSVKKKILPYINDGLVYAIGSDLHSVDKKAYSQFKKAEKKLGDEYAKIMERSTELLKNATRF